ncbi:response regulator [Pararcticibacter amylolyticus]|uniref:Two-component system response regulator n=1 Tax=Pararcticibacter amylolyticus TaxID=2173175 RepID=A0A2U2PL81_9SPHI|nr:response regulator [Pararcticibacter amylolyticus]PWG82165.1 two-component system response regulator [Pararcticibacter amylolyticus]
MKKRILIVDDEISILKLLNFVLSKDYDLTIKNSGVEAIDWLEQGNDPDLVISDLQMPYFDGSSFVRNLKISGYYRDTPVILLSGVDNLEEKVNKMQFRLEGHLQKPFNPTTLKTMIGTLLSKSEKQ